MGRALFVCLCVLVAVAPQAVRAESFQQYSDGLVSVTAKKVLGSDQRIAFEVCAQLMRKENVGPLQVRLNLWGTTGAFVRQLSSVVHPELSAPACQRIQVPVDVGTVGRWEVARFQFLREQTPHRAGRIHQAG
jgi:hypothetical protein